MFQKTQYQLINNVVNIIFIDSDQFENSSLTIQK